MFLSIYQYVPAETTNYMLSGYTVIFGIMLLYLVSLVIRARNLERDLESLSELEQVDE